MAGSGTESAVIVWNAPQCPFTIECSARVMDDIRLAVTDAFFSLPRGGAEIGGILLGGYEDGLVTISEYAALECEHAFGPSFQISLNDEARLKDLLASVPDNFPGLEVVGWYHSHTRSGIFLSEADLEIYNLYFSEAWQVALVMKPHTFEPTRIGYFFRGPDGRVHSESSYQEMILQAQPMRQVPTGPPPEAAPRSNPQRGDRARRLTSQIELDASAEIIPEPEEVPEPEQVEPEPALAPIVAPRMPIRSARSQALRRREPEPEEELEARPEPPVPQFLTQHEEKPSHVRMILTAATGVLLTLGAIGAAVKTRDAWLPKLISAVRPATPAAAPAAAVAPLPPPSLGLRAADRDGQLDISWDRASVPIREAKEGLLEISDGGPMPQSISMDSAHLQAGSFTYGRQSEKVDVKLIVRNAEGQEFRQVASFLGKLPDRKPQEDAEALRKEREAMAAQAAKMKLDLNWQSVKQKKLEKELQTVRDELRQQQQRRLLNQAPEK
jgi:proteasome lid subunit RPN8/RPN11